MSGRIGKLQIIVGTLALVFAFVLGSGGNIGINSASALTIGTVNGGWTPGNFASSCEAAGGQLIEVKGNGKNYSKCEFPSGDVNTCDWVKKICTFGIMAGPFKTGNFQINGTLSTGSLSTGGTTTSTTTSTSIDTKSR